MPDSSAPKSAKDTFLPLSKLTVLDLTIARAGPTAVRHLADWGANVIHIDPPQAKEDDLTGKRDGHDFQNLHRNKRMMLLDLKNPAGHAAFMRLVEKADVIIENMRPPVKKKLKIAWEDVHKVNPRLVYGSISGFGQDGPYAERGGVDQIAQGMSGLMTISGNPGQGPIRTGIAVSDMTAGNLLALGVMMALFERQTTGKGRWVQTSLLESLLFMLDFQASRWLMKGEVAGQTGNDHPTGTPTGVYKTADGYINIGAAGNGLFGRLGDELGHPEWKDKPEWKTIPMRTKDRPAVNSAIDAVTMTKPSAYWVEKLAAKGIPAGPIYTVDQAFADPQVKHLRMSRKAKHPRLGDIEIVASPLHIGDASKDIRYATRDTGADTREVLTEAGFSKAEIDDLAAKGAI